MKDRYGNNLRLIEHPDEAPEKSRFKVSFQFHDQEGKITLLAYSEVMEGIFGHGYEWEIFAEPYGLRRPYKGRMSEKTVLESVGLWITNNITGETYEYLHESPVMVGRPMNLKENLV